MNCILVEFPLFIVSLAKNIVSPTPPWQGVYLLNDKTPYTIGFVSSKASEAMSRFSKWRRPLEWSLRHQALPTEHLNQKIFLFDAQPYTKQQKERFSDLE
jgi:hypothetical protein